nr:transposase [Methylomonas rapida]
MRYAYPPYELLIQGRVDKRIHQTKAITLMSEYRRIFVPGGHYFFTVVTYLRRPVFSEFANVEVLRAAFKQVMAAKPFEIEAIVILPDHLHCLWRLPLGDADFSGRWREIKKYVSKRIGGEGKRTGERDVWQRRFWDHLIRDEEDWRRHVDYVHFNPVKHGLATAPSDWPYSSFRKFVAAGLYDAGWASGGLPDNIKDLHCE